MEDSNSFHRVQIDEGSKHLWEEQLRKGKEKAKGILDKEAGAFILIWTDKVGEGGGALTHAPSGKVRHFLAMLDTVIKQMIAESIHSTIMSIEKGVKENEGKGGKDTKEDGIQGPEPKTDRPSI